MLIVITSIFRNALHSYSNTTTNEGVNVLRQRSSNHLTEIFRTATPSDETFHMI